jgi:ornithine cyclodeaminase
MVIAAVRRAMMAAVDGSSEVFPVVLGAGSAEGTGFGCKSGRISASGSAEKAAVGLKVGSYWPENRAADPPLAAHGSTTLLLDDATGYPSALVNAHLLNGYRTAAANAVACDLLARPDAQRAAIFGAGGQAMFEAQAVCQVRPIEQLAIVGRSRASAEALAARLRAWLAGPHRGLARPGCEVVVAVSGDEGGDDDVCWAAHASDIVVTVTPARLDAGGAPLFPHDSLRPGTHVSAMGADAPGKGELDWAGLGPAVAAERARLFADLPVQSRRVGEFQHAGPNLEIAAIGQAISKAGAHRSQGALWQADTVTVFDSSGIALQDLAAAVAVLEAAEAKGLVRTIDF